MKCLRILPTIILGISLVACDSTSPLQPQATANKELSRATDTVRTASPSAVGAKLQPLVATLTAIASLPTATKVAVSPVAATTDASPEALAYLTDVFDYIQQHSIMRDKVDWDALRRVALGPGQHPQTTSDTYPAIKYIIAHLGDNHSQFYDPAQAKDFEDLSTKSLGVSVKYSDRVIRSVEPSSPAAKAGIKVGDFIEQVNGISSADMGASAFYINLYQGPGVSLDLRRPGEGQPIGVTINYPWADQSIVPKGRTLEGGIGFIHLPGTSSINKEYAGIAQDIIRDIDKEPTCGWVIDLQGNGGGDPAPMVAGVGPILGEGNVGWFVLPDSRTPWSYRNGYADLNPVFARVDEPYYLKKVMPPVALLTNRYTASAAEITLLAFHGRPLVRTFGEPTKGVPTDNVIRRLSDGAMLILTEGYDADRTGQVYTTSIPPDQAVTPDLTLTGTNDDPVLKAAVKWLSSQPACSE